MMGYCLSGENLSVPKLCARKVTKLIFTPSHLCIQTMSVDTIEVLRHHNKVLADELKLLRLQPSSKLDEIVLAFKAIENDVHEMKDKANDDDKRLHAIHDALQDVHRALEKLTDMVHIRTPQNLAKFDETFMTDTHPAFGGRRNINYPNSIGSSDSDEVYSSSSDDDNELLKEDDDDTDTSQLEYKEALDQDTDGSSDMTSEDDRPMYKAANSADSDVTSADGDFEHDESGDSTESDTNSYHEGSDSDMNSDHIF